MPTNVSQFGQALGHSFVPLGFPCLIQEGAHVGAVLGADSGGNIAFRE